MDDTKNNRFREPELRKHRGGEKQGAQAEGTEKKDGKGMSLTI